MAVASTSGFWMPRTVRAVPVRFLLETFEGGRIGDRCK
jgi:hypothetical protein